ncbi:MAG TPA: peptide ABC transporter substrate-binding protein [Armatimonadota bacterium]
MAMRPLPEADWKYMRRLQPVLLNRLCEQINTEMVRILQEDAGTPHERYLNAFKHLQDADDIMADCFNDWRRSTLLQKLGALLHHDVLTPEEAAGLSAEMRAIVTLFYER